MAAASSAAAVALYDIDPDTVSALVLACPAVAGLSAGRFGAAATYLPGRQVTGVRISGDTVEVHVISRYGPTVAELAGQVRTALSGRVLGRTVDIVVEDLTDRPGPTTLPGTSPPARPLGQRIVPPVAGQAVGPADVPVAGEAGPTSPGTLPGTAEPRMSPAARPSRWTRPGRPG